MDNEENAKPYDLEERTAVFAEQSRAFVKKLQRTIGNIEDAKQFIRASGSVGANYVEGKRINRKEGLSNEDQDLPTRSEGKPLLAALA